MESEGSLPHSQVPATCPYPEPDLSSPYPHIPLTELTGDPSYYYLLIYAWVFQVVSFPQVSPTKPSIHPYSHPYVLHVPLLSFVLNKPTVPSLIPEHRIVTHYDIRQELTNEYLCVIES